MPDYFLNAVDRAVCRGCGRYVDDDDDRVVPHSAEQCVVALLDRIDDLREDLALLRMRIDDLEGIADFTLDRMRNAVTNR